MDDNDTLHFSDSHTSEERRIIRELLGPEKYPQRWNKTMELFFNSGGMAHFVIYYGARHVNFYKGMTEDYINFFEANRESKTPVYPKLSDPSSSLGHLGLD